MDLRRALAAGLVLVAAACSPGGDASLAGPRPSPPTASRSSPVARVAGVPAPEPSEAPAGIVRVQGCEPHSLLPANAARSCGQQVVTALYSPLVDLDPLTGAPRWGDDTDNGVAASVDSIDGRRWVIELEDSWQFHDGSPVTAQSFVDAWNFAALSPNGQADAFLFRPILGFEDLHCPEPGCEPSDTTLDGLRAIDDTTLEVVLAAPDRSFPRRLAHVAFSPLPAAAREDPDAFAEAPIGNGPFRIDGAWEHERRIALRAVEDHPGGAPAAAGVDVLLFDDLEAAWQALLDGTLDVATALPPAHRDEATRRFARSIRGGDDYEALVVPSYRPALAEDDRLARAISMAIDREQLIEEQLGGAARPARGLVPPAVSDEVDRCGSTCRFDPAAARRLLAQVGLPPGGLELWLDRSAGHEAWVRAIAQQLRQHLQLGPAQVRVRSLDHTSWLSHLQDRRVGGLYPTGWSMDVPSEEEYLEALHGPGGLFNFDGYTGVDAGAQLAAAASAPTDRDARLRLRRLEQDLLDDMHHIPLWVRTHEAVYTNRVTGVAMDAAGRVRLDELALVDTEG